MSRNNPPKLRWRGKSAQIKSENPPKLPWRAKTSADNTRFPVKSILAGNLDPNANPGTYNPTIKPQRSDSFLAVFSDLFGGTSDISGRIPEQRSTFTTFRGLFLRRMHTQEQLL